MSSGLAVILIIVSLVMISGCGLFSMEVPATPTEIIPTESIAPLATRTLPATPEPLLQPTREGTSPASTNPPPLSTPGSFLAANFSVDFLTLPDLTGTLYLGYRGDPGRYLAVIFPSQEIRAFQLPPACSLLPSGDQALCFAGADAYLEDLQTANKKMLPCDIPISTSDLEISPSSNFIFYDANPESSSSIKLVVCDLTKFTQRVLVEMGRDEWDDQFRLSVSGKGLAFSREQFSLADSGQFLVGVGTFPGYSSQRQYALIRFNPLTKRIIYSDSDPLSANDISWAYQQNIVLLGAESQRVSQEEGFCTDSLLTYTPATETVRVLLSLPQGECFDAFGLYSAHAPWYVSPEVWSPDNRHIAMTRGNGSDLCIINAETGDYNCINLLNREQWIFSWAWSPDSNWVALLTRDGELFVYSVHEKSLIAIGKSDAVWEKLPSFLVWSSAVNPDLPKP